MSRGCAKASACRLHVNLSCTVLCQIISLRYLSRSSLHRLACRLFLSLWSQSCDKLCPAQDHFIFLTLLIIVYEFCLLSDSDVGLSVLVCDVEHTSFHFGLCGRKFVLCLFGQCPGLCTICHTDLPTSIHFSVTKKKFFRNKR